MKAPARHRVISGRCRARSFPGLAATAGALLLGSSLLACATMGASSEDLKAAVTAYNQHLRWQRYSSAAAFLPSSQRQAFLTRYISAEDDLHVESIDVRNIQWAPHGDVPGADVIAVAQMNLLPSTIVHKVLLQERWELRHGNWLLVACNRQLAPPPHRLSP